MKKSWRRVAGEFGVIVVGVLVALAVDDFRQSVEDRLTERHVLTRLLKDVGRDLEDLDRVILRAERRIWVVNALMRELGDPHAEDETPLPTGRGMANPDRFPVDFEFDPWTRPLEEFETWTEFDLSDATYDELLHTGVFRVIDGKELRESITQYYFHARDNSRAERRVGQSHEQFLGTLHQAGVVPTDPLSLEELAEQLRTLSQPSLELRRFRYMVERQLFNYGQIWGDAMDLQTELTSRIE